jgi:hypothetical protein
MGPIKLVVLGVALVGEAVELLASWGRSSRPSPSPRTRRRPHSPEADQVWQHSSEVTPYRVAELPEGEIGRLEGSVRQHARTLCAPLSGRACVYYMVLVEQAGAIRWTECDGVAFALQDASGRAIIEPALATVALLLDHREQARALREATPQQDAVLARHGYDLPGGDGLVFYEAVLLAGERATVVGAGRREPAGGSSQESDFRSPPAMQLRVAGTTAAPLSIASHRAR